MTDLHTHILPGMDDGCRDVSESLQLLEQSAAQGIRTVACTSHFYPTQNSPEQFLARRAAAAERLFAAMPDTAPQILLGAEVYYFDGIDRAPSVEALQIGDSGVLLVEMPFTAWTSRMISEIKALHGRNGITVLLAHIERYLSWQPMSTWETLRSAGIMTHCNADFFLNWRTGRRARRMLRDGLIDFIASDCHNTTSRPQKLGLAMKKLTSEERRHMEARLSRLFPDYQLGHTPVDDGVLI